MDNSLPDKQRSGPLRAGTGKANGGRLLGVAKPASKLVADTQLLRGTSSCPLAATVPLP
jgi:hypothetical protein